MHKVIINSKDLQSGCEYLLKVIEKRPNVPILENIHLQVVESFITLSGSDLTTTISVSWPCESATNFSAVIPTSIVKALKGIDVPLVATWDPESYSLELPGLKSKVKVSGENPDNYPAWPEVFSEGKKIFDLPTDFFPEFKSLLRCTSPDPTRPALHGIAFNFYRGYLNALCSDGNRFILQPINERSEKWKELFVIPKKLARILSDTRVKAPGSAEVFLQGVNVGVRFKKDFLHVEIISRITDEKFPAWWKVIPASKETATRYTFEKEPFLKLLQIAEKYSDQDTHKVVLKLKEDPQLEAVDADRGCEMIEKLPGQVKGAGLDIGLDTQLLRELLNSFSEKVTMELIAPDKCVIIREKNKLALLMPLLITHE